MKTRKSGYQRTMDLVPASPVWSLCRCIPSAAIRFLPANPLAAVTLAVMGLSFTTAHALTFTWKGGGSETTPTSGNWGDAVNWTEGLPTGANPTLVFQGSGGTAYTSTNNLSIADSTIQLNSSASVTEIINGNNFAPIDDLLTISQLGSGAFSISNGAVFKSAVLTLNGNGTGIATLIGAFTDSQGNNNKGALVKDDASTYVLTNIGNEFGDGITINGGVLRFTSLAALGLNTTLINTGGILGLDTNFNVAAKIRTGSTGIVALNADNSTLTGVNGTSTFIGSLGNFTYSGSTLAAGSGSTYRLGGGGGTLTITATNVITGPNAVIIGNTQTNGAGTVVISAGQNYTGATTINAGKLTIGASGNINSTSGITIAGGEFNYNSGTALSKTVTFNGTGGFLTGTGTITNAVSVTAGNTYTPGERYTSGVGATVADTQTLTGGINFAANSIFEWDIDVLTASTDKHDTVTGSLSGSAAKFNVLLGEGDTYAMTFWDSNRIWSDIFSAGSTLTSVFSSITGTGIVWDGTKGVVTGQGSFAFGVGGDTNKLTWTAVPEPTSALAGALLAAGLLRRRRQRA